MDTTFNPAIRRARGPGDTGRKSAQSPAVMSAVLCLVSLLVVIGPVRVTPASAHGPAANGCTGVLDSGYGFAFHGICDRHDRCYGTKPYGSGAAGRRSCDRVFRSAMLGYCRRHRTFSGKGISCRSVAHTYYYGVRALGGSSWQAGVPSPIG